MSNRMHWAEVRKTLEQDFLCDSLKGRVRYFATKYRHAHDQTGRVCILVDDKEIISMPFETEHKLYAEAHRRKPGSGKSLKELSDEVSHDFHEHGIFEPYEFGVAFDEFTCSSIQDSLKSENWLVRLMAILDRRVGKRTLEKVRADMSEIPDWLMFFYKLRLESEGML